MSDNAEPTSATFDPRRFRTTVPFYARYRLGYSDALVTRAAALAGLRPGDAVMDLGCGPGLLAVPLARLGFKVVAVDPEPDMVDACRAAAQEAGVAVDVRLGSSFDLPAGPFRLVTMGRSFHWMDRAATLRSLDRIVTADGALAFFEDDHPETMENAWRRALRDIGDRYGRMDSPNVAVKRQADYRSQVSLLLDSAFARLEGVSEVVRRTRSADEIVGLALSTSTMSPARLGERGAAFETELRAALAALSPDGVFTEIAELNALVARRSVAA
ncbi:MAG TPA: class I SAM-dependent methyltransferase [Rhizomicrobium sp.]|jgi:SAM-dependent methyltransferase|nr:class I SAM-dependent methyltransferase [Rhizomicrobium sp.]